ncbi:MAG: hypothetical protein WCX28_05955 [Bacteriovoracaceae bacterium]|nr:hypothetical protein [Bacteroidota bacterium]
MNVKVVIVLFVLLISGCAEDKYPMAELNDVPSSKTIGDTLYVQQNPSWAGFNRPQAIIIGNDRLIYVADTENNRLVMLDLFGHVIGTSPFIKRPIGLAQDMNLNLIVCAEFDTTLPGRTTPTTFGAIYKLNLFDAKHNLSNAVVKRVYFEPSDTVRRFTAVATLYNNWYGVTRVGNKNDISRIDKDIAIMQFDNLDNYVSPIPNFTPEGTGLKSLDSLTGIATLPTGRSVEFVFCQKGINSLYKIQWIRLVTIGQTTDFISKFDPTDDPSLGILSVNRFVRPEGITFDASGNVFMIDAGTDSLYHFSSRGIESYSFGGKTQFKQPHGVAYYDKTLYIADTGNNRIVRFKLSTDF